jgi:predicted phage terminase large subunit-like protein
MSLSLELSLDPRLPLKTICGLFNQLKDVVAAEHGKARRRAASMPTTRLLDWSRKHLPHYFTANSSRMHTWLAAKLDGLAKVAGTLRVPSAAASSAASGDLVQDRRVTRDTADGTRRVPATLPRSHAAQSPNLQINKSPNPHLNLLAPRGAAKSTLGTLSYVLKAALEKIEPYIWIVSDTKHQACAHLENIKSELVENRSLAADYAAAGVGTTWRNNRITLRNGVTIEAFGTGQRIRGRRRRENRPTLIVCDDLQNDGHILSPTQRERSRTWFHGTLMKAGTPRTTVINLATALHRDALAMELHHNPGWTSGVFRSILRWPDNMSLWRQWEEIYTGASRSRLVEKGEGGEGRGESDEGRPAAHPSSLIPHPSSLILPPPPNPQIPKSPNPSSSARRFYEEHRAEMDAGAILLWPEVEDLYTLMCMRVDGGHGTFEREKQNSPINPEFCEWPETYFDERIWFDTWPAGLVVKTMALDPSKGTGSGRGDFSAFVCLGVNRQGVVYIEADQARRGVPEIVADGVERFRLFQPHAFGIEANQFQDLFAGQFETEFRRIGLLTARPLPIDNQTPKQVRIRRLGPYLSTRRLRFKTDSPGTKLLVEQLMQFPIADHDDGPDALEMALRLAEQFVANRIFHDGLGDRLPVG